MAEMFFTLFFKTAELANILKLFEQESRLQPISAG